MQRQVVVIAGPSGSGKNSVIDALIGRYPRCVRLVTATTRAPRPGEQNGVDYYFLSNDEFMSALSAGDVLEHRFVHSLNTHYGVYKPDLDKKLGEGKIIIAHLDIVGVRYMQEHYDAATFFIMPSSLDELEGRIRTSARSMDDAELSKRMDIAKKEMTEDAPECDYRIINANGKLEKAVDEVVAILKKEGYTL